MTRAKHILVSARRRIQAIFDRLTGEWRPLFEPRIASDHMVTQMKAASIPTIGVFFMLALSGAIATFECLPTVHLRLLVR